VDKKSKLIYWYIGVISSAIIIVTHLLGFFSGFENILEDRLFSDKQLDNRIVIVAIDDKSLSQLGQWPWPREIFAEFFSKLETARPLVVGLDVMFAEPSRLGNTDDTALENALKNISYKLVMPLEIREDAATVLPLQKFFNANIENIALGHVNFVIDKDNVAREFPAPLRENNGKVIVSFSQKVAEFAGIKNKNMDGKIVYAGRPGSFPMISFSDAILENQSFFENKIALVGATAPDLHDEQRTPVSQGELMSGVEIQANIVNMLSRGYMLKDTGAALSLILIILVGIFTSFLFSFFKNVRILAASFFFLFILILVGGIVSFENGIVLRLVDLFGNMFFAGALMLGYKYSISEQHKKELKKIFSKYVSPQVLSKILLAPEQITLGGEEKHITVLFSDIRGFTSLSENTSPSELVVLLNEYFTEMTDEILKQDGVLDKYIGDAIMAFWGAPIEDNLHADKAVKAALGMAHRLDDFNKILKERGKPAIKNGIGIYTGPAIVGNIGAKDRFDYTAIGDTVNCAARLESATKELDATIVIGASTKNFLTEKYNLKDRGVIMVKGKTKGLNVYSVLG